MTAAFTISLDFELHWGVRDKRSVNQYGPTLLGARRAVPLMLESFRRHQVAVTWAIVGLLCFDDKSEMIDHLPGHRPAYRRPGLSPYPEIATLGRNEREDPFHFGRSLVRLILDTPRMELGTHTFSHYYCLEEGQDSAAFAADLQAALAAAATVGARPTSIVFPRNQYDAAALEVSRISGLTAFRGNGTSWFYQPRSGDDESRARRAGRLVDAHFPLTKASTFPTEGHCAVPADITATRLLRPVGPRRGLSPRLRVARIRRGMTAAARQGLGYHLWWHPHNFGTHIEENLALLDDLLHHYQRLEATYGMRSMTMGEAAASLVV